MKFLIDAQLPRRLAHQLRAAGFETIHTLDLPQGNRTSGKMLSAASLDAAVCLTKTVYPRAGYNLLQLSVSADNSIQSWFRSSAASRPGCHMSPYHKFDPI